VSSPDLSFVYPLVREMPAVTIDERPVIVRLGKSCVAGAQLTRGLTISPRRQRRSP